jgi:hypothetical protein
MLPQLCDTIPCFLMFSETIADVRPSVVAILSAATVTARKQ